MSKTQKVDHKLIKMTRLLEDIIQTNFMSSDFFNPHEYKNELINKTINIYIKDNIIEENTFNYNNYFDLLYKAFNSIVNKAKKGLTNNSPAIKYELEENLKNEFVKILEEEYFENMKTLLYTENKENIVDMVIEKTFNPIIENINIQDTQENKKEIKIENRKPYLKNTIQINNNYIINTFLISSSRYNYRYYLLRKYESILKKAEKEYLNKNYSLKNTSITEWINDFDNETRGIGENCIWGNIKGIFWWLFGWLLK